MSDCKYQSFTALSKTNDPDLLLACFIANAAPEHTDDVNFLIFEQKNSKWSLLSSTDHTYNIPSEDHVKNLNFYQNNNDSHDYFVYNKTDNSWYASYHELMHSNYALIITPASNDFLVDTAYLQQLFHFYCHQLTILHGTYHDSLTGLLNRRSFDKKLLNLIDQCHNTHRKKADQPSFYVMVDIDHFKNINDNFGHLYGDEVLLQLAQLMEDSFRGNDLLFRYGGEEFAIVLMNTSQTEARSILERFRLKVENYSFPKIDKVTISIGYTIFDTDINIDRTIAKADSALYYSKENGRNLTSEYEQLVSEGKIEDKEFDPDITLISF